MDAEKDLCETLDDLGISWWKVKDSICWTTSSERLLSICQCYVNDNDHITLTNHLYNLNPSQVIARTVFPPNADRIIINKGDYGSCRCSICDNSVELSFIYCPYCRSKFVNNIYKIEK